MSDYWKDNSIEKPEETIVCACNKIGDVLLTGARHWDSVMCLQADALGLDGGDEEQGFINQFGEFRTREEAYEIVKNNKQEVRGDLEFNYNISGWLFSEHLY